MIFNPKNKIVKIIAAIVCVCFLWQDVVFASGGDFLRQRQFYAEGENNGDTASAAGAPIINLNDIGLLGALITSFYAALVAFGMSLRPDRQDTPAVVAVIKNIFRYIWGLAYLQIAYQMAANWIPAVHGFVPQFFKWMLVTVFGGTALVGLMPLYHSIISRLRLAWPSKAGWLVVITLSLLFTIPEVFHTLKVFAPTWYIHELLHPNDLSGVLPAWAARIAYLPGVDAVASVFAGISNAVSAVFLKVFGSFYCDTAFSIFPNITDLLIALTALSWGYKTERPWLKAFMYSVASGYFAFHFSYFMQGKIGLESIVQESGSLGDYDVFKLVWANLPDALSIPVSGGFVLASSAVLFLGIRSLARLTTGRLKSAGKDAAISALLAAALIYLIAVSAPKQLAIALKSPAHKAAQILRQDVKLMSEDELYTLLEGYYNHDDYLIVPYFTFGLPNRPVQKASYSAVEFTQLRKAIAPEKTDTNPLDILAREYSKRIKQRFKKSSDEDVVSETKDALYSIKDERLKELLGFKEAYEEKDKVSPYEITFIAGVDELVGREASASIRDVAIAAAMLSKRDVLEIESSFMYKASASAIGQPALIGSKEFRYEELNSIVSVSRQLGRVVPLNAVELDSVELLSGTITRRTFFQTALMAAGLAEALRGDENAPADKILKMYEESKKKKIIFTDKKDYTQGEAGDILRILLDYKESIMSEGMPSVTGKAKSIEITGETSEEKIKRLKQDCWLKLRKAAKDKNFRKYLDKKFSAYNFEEMLFFAAPEFMARHGIYAHFKELIIGKEKSSKIEVLTMVPFFFEIDAIEKPDFSDRLESKLRKIGLNINQRVITGKMISTGFETTDTDADWLGKGDYCAIAVFGPSLNKTISFLQENSGRLSKNVKPNLSHELIMEQLEENKDIKSAVEFSSSVLLLYYLSLIRGTTDETEIIESYKSGIDNHEGTHILDTHDPERRLAIATEPSYPDDILELANILFNAHVHSEINGILGELQYGPMLESLNSFILNIEDRQGGTGQITQDDEHRIAAQWIFDKAVELIIKRGPEKFGMITDKNSRAGIKAQIALQFFRLAEAQYEAETRRLADDLRAEHEKIYDYKFKSKLQMPDFGNPVLSALKPAFMAAAAVITLSFIALKYRQKRIEEARKAAEEAAKKAKKHKKRNPPKNSASAAGEAAQATGEEEWLEEFDNGLDLSRSSWGAIPKAFRRALVVQRLLPKLNASLQVQRKPHQLTSTNFTEIEIRQTADRVRTLNSLYAWYAKEFPGDEGQVLTNMLHDLNDPEVEGGVLLPEGQERVLIWHKEERERAKRKIAQFITNCAVYEPDFENNGFFKETKRQKPLSGEELKNFLLENDLLRHENWTRPAFSRAVFRDWYFSTTGIVDTVAGGTDQFYDLIEEAVPGIMTAEEISGSKSRVKVNGQLRLFYRYANYIEKEVIEALEKKKTESETRSVEFLEKAARARARQDELFNKASDAEQAAKKLEADISKYKMDFNRLKEYGLQAICDKPISGELMHDEELLKMLESWSGIIEKWIKRLFNGNNPDEKFVELFEAVSIGLFTRDDLDAFEEKQLLDDICEVFGGSNGAPYAGHQVDPDKASELSKIIKLTVLNKWDKKVDGLKEILFEQLKQLGISGKITLTNLKEIIRKSRAFEAARYIADDCLQQEKSSVLDLDGRFGLFYSALSDAEKADTEITTVSDPVSSRLGIARPAKQMPNRMLIGADEAEAIKDKFGLVTSIFGLHPGDTMAVQRLVSVSQNALKTGGRLAIALPHTLGFYSDAIDKMQECGFRLEHQILVREQLGDLEAIELLIDRPEELQRRKGQSPRFILAVFTKTEDASIPRTDMAVSKIDWRDAAAPADAAEEQALPFALVRPGKDMPEQPVIKPVTQLSEKIPGIRYRGEHERLAHLLKLIVKYQKYILQDPEAVNSSYAASYMTLNRLLQNVFDIEVKKDTIAVKLRVGEDDISELSYRIKWVLSSPTLRDVTVQLGVLFNRLTETYAAANANGSFSVFKEYPDFERWMEVIYIHRENEFLFSQDEREFIEWFANDCWLDASRPPAKEEAGRVKQLFVMNVQRYCRNKHWLFWLATARKKPEQLAAYLNTDNPLSAYTSLITYFSAHRVMDILKKQLSNARAIVLDIGAGTGTGSVSMYNTGFNLNPDSGVRMIEVDNNLGLLNVPRVVRTPSADLEIPTTKVLGNAQELTDALNGNDITKNPVNLKEGSADAITSLFLVHLFKSGADRMNFFLEARKWLKPGGVFALTYPAGIQFNKEMIQELHKMGYGVSVPELYSQKVKDDVEEKITKWVARKYPEVYHNHGLRQRIVERVRSFAEKQSTMLLLWKEKDVTDEELKGINPDNFAILERAAEETRQAQRRPAPVLKPEGGLPFDVTSFTVRTIAEEWLLTEAHPEEDLEENQEKLLSREELSEIHPEFETTLAYLHNYRELFGLAERVQIDNVFESWHSGAQLISEAAISLMQGYYRRPQVLGRMATIQQNVTSLVSSIQRDFPAAALCIAASLPEEEQRSFLHTANRLRGQAHLGDSNTLSLAELASLEKWSMPLAGLYGFYETQFVEIYRNSSEQNIQTVFSRMDKNSLAGLFEQKAKRSAMLDLLAELSRLAPEAVCYNFDPHNQPEATAKQVKQAAFASAEAFVDALYKKCCTRTKQGTLIEGWAQASINEICRLFPDIKNPLAAATEAEKEKPAAEIGFAEWPEFVLFDLAAIMQKKQAEGENSDAIPYTKEIVEHPVLGLIPIEEISSACDHISLKWAAIFPQLEPPATWQLDEGEKGVIKNLFAQLSRSQTADNTIRIYKLLNNFLSARNSANRRLYARPRLVANGQNPDMLEFKDSAERIKMPRLEAEHSQLISDILQVEFSIDKNAAADSDTVLENAIKDLTNYALLLGDPDTDNLLKIIICSNISTYIPKVGNPRLLYDKIFSLPFDHPLKAYFSKDISLTKRVSLKDGLREYFLKHPFQQPSDITEILKSGDEDRKTELVTALKDLFINDNDPYVLFGAYLTFYDLLKYQHPRRDEYLRRMFDYIEVCFTERFANPNADIGISAFFNWQIALTADTLFGQNASVSKEFVTRLYRSRTNGWMKILAKINEAKDLLDSLDTAGFEDLINSLELMKFTTGFPVGFSGQQDEFGADIKPDTFINLDRLIETLSFPQGKEAILYYFIKLHKQLLADIAVRAVDQYKKENSSSILPQQLDYAASVLQRLGLFNIIDKRALESGCFDAADIQFYEHLALTAIGGSKETIDKLPEGASTDEEMDRLRALDNNWQKFFPYESENKWINNSRHWMKNWFMASPENQQKAALLFKEPIASKEETTVLKGLAELFLKAPDEDSWSQINAYILNERSMPRAVAFMQLINKRRVITENPKILENVARLEEFSSELLEKLGLVVKDRLKMKNLFNNMRARKGLADVYNDPVTEMADRIRILGISAPHEQFLYEFIKGADEEARKDYAGLMSMEQKAFEQEEQLLIKSLSVHFGLDDEATIKRVHNTFVPGKSVIEYISPERHHEFDATFANMLISTNPAVVNGARKALTVRLKNLSAEIEAGAGAAGKQRQALIENIWQNVLTASGALKSKGKPQTVTLPTLDDQLEVLRPLVLACPDPFLHGKIIGQIFDADYRRKDPDNELFFKRLDTHLVPLLNGLDRAFVAVGIELERTLTEITLEAVLPLPVDVPSKENFEVRLRRFIEFDEFCRQRMPQGRKLSTFFHINSITGLFYEEIEASRPFFIDFMKWLVLNNFIGLTEEEIRTKLKTMPQSQLHQWFLLKEDSFPDGFGEKFLNFQQAWDALLADQPAVNWRRVWFDAVFEKACEGVSGTEEPDVAFVNHAQRMRLLNDAITARPVEKAGETAVSLESGEPIFNRSNLYDIIQMHRDCHSIANKTDEPDPDRHKAAMGVRALEKLLAKYYLSRMPSESREAENERIRKRDAIAYLLHDLRYRTPWFSVDSARLTNNFAIYKFFLILNTSLSTNKDDASALMHFYQNMAGLLADVTDFRERRKFLDLAADVLEGCGVIQEDSDNPDIGFRENPQLRRGILCYHLAKCALPLSDFEYLREKLPKIRQKGSVKFSNATNIVNIINNSNAGVCLIIDQLYSGGIDNIAQIMEDASLESDPAKNERVVRYIINAIRPQDGDFSSFMMFVTNARLQHLLRQSGQERIGIPAPDLVLYTIFDLFKWAMTIRPDVLEAVKNLELSDDPIVALTARDLITAHTAGAAGNSIGNLPTYEVGRSTAISLAVGQAEKRMFARYMAALAVVNLAEEAFLEHIKDKAKNKKALVIASDPKEAMMMELTLRMIGFKKIDRIQKTGLTDIDILRLTEANKDDYDYVVSKAASYGYSLIQYSQGIQATAIPDTRQLFKEIIHCL